MLPLAWIAGMLTLAGFVMTMLGAWAPHLLHLHG
jgi:hypothetical protein